MHTYDIPYYLDFLPEELLRALDRDAEPIAGVGGLRVAPGLVTAFPELESTEALTFICALYREIRSHLREVLDQRSIDRAFIDRETLACRERNQNRPYRDAGYETVLGRRDARGRVVVGPSAEPPPVPVAVEVPEFLRGDQVTLFGPPDTRKLSINAMNALHRRLPDEAPIVAELVQRSGQVPRWGADDEDSKTPIMEDFLQACENLSGCFQGTLRLEDGETGRTYALASSGLSLPIKRIPGLALPDGSHLLEGNPLPLHLFDFGLHLFHNWSRPESLVFYVPKLENEEEAAYVRNLISTAERLIRERFPEYRAGSVRVLVVFESPRAIFRIQEIAAALHPHFLGGSLGWHDFLASTARLFRYDPNYRIPVKADPDIVIKHIRESHLILVRALGPLQAIKIGGMYGVLYEEGDPRSFQVSMVGYIRDVVTQLKRGLDGFWVAHPNFVRIGIALVEAWRGWSPGGNRWDLERLLEALVGDPEERAALTAFVFQPDGEGLSQDHPRYLRSVLAADLETSELIPNHDPEEVRYNVFQALQYLADWLRGNGCVALPAHLTDLHGRKVSVRVMDDLATTERSRWELWAEVFHGRVSRETFERILQEEVRTLREDREEGGRRIQVHWRGDAGRWYPVAVRLLRQLVVDPGAVEFVTQLLLPFTFAPVRQAADPWEAAIRWCPGRYSAS